MPTKPRTTTIAIRITSEVRRRIEAVAEQRGMTISELAREQILTCLSDSSFDHLNLRLSAIESEIAELRKDVAVSTEVLLVEAGKMPLEYSSGWVRSNLKR